jgi:HlyD family type I secretion membrane fusion protein
MDHPQTAAANTLALVPDRRMRMPPGPGSRVIWILCLFILALLAWSVVGELAVVTSARGRVVSEGQIQSVQPAVSGTARVVHVKGGDTVREGDLLVTLEDALYRSDVELIEERIAQLNIELSRLAAESGVRVATEALPPDARTAAQRALQTARETNLRYRRHELSASLEARRAALASGESALQGQQARLAIAQEKERRALPYVDIAVPRFQFLQLKDDVVGLERDVAAQRATNVRLAQEITEARLRLAQVESIHKQEVAREISDKQSAVAVATAELQKARKRLADTLVRAPESGVVQKVMVTTVGASVTPADVLVQIVPARSRLLIEVLIPNEEKGHLVPGQPVDVKLDAFPFQKYGRLQGRLEWVSPDAELSTNANVSLLTEAAQLRAVTSSSPQYVFRGHVVTEPASNKALLLAPGLTAQVDIYTDRRRILDFFLFPLERATGEALRVR